MAIFIEKFEPFSREWHLSATKHAKFEALFHRKLLSFRKTSFEVHTLTIQLCLQISGNVNIKNLRTFQKITFV